jgi:hypothetical protein
VFGYFWRDCDLLLVFCMPELSKNVSLIGSLKSHKYMCKHIHIRTHKGTHACTSHARMHTHKSINAKLTEIYADCMLNSALFRPHVPLWNQDSNKQ